MSIRAEGIVAGYGRRDVVNGVDLIAEPGRVTALFGHNGAGKSTLLRVLAGLLRLRAGRVELGERAIERWPAWRRRQAGLAMVPQQRAVFAELTVSENLRLGAAADRAGDRLAQVLDVFPVLKTRLQVRAGALSGGQQRMLAIGVGLMGGPRVLLLDEPTIGLQPNIAQQLLGTIRDLTRSGGLTTLLVEQAVQRTAERSDYIYVMKVGRIIAAEPAESFRSRDELWSLF